MEEMQVAGLMEVVQTDEVAKEVEEQVAAARVAEATEAVVVGAAETARWVDPAGRGGRAAAVAAAECQEAYVVVAGAAAAKVVAGMARVEVG